MSENRNSLQSGYKLHWYVIKEVLGQGGFGITYLAEDTNLNQLVAIKEYLPIDMAVREGGISIHPVSGEYGDQFKWGLDRFITEAQTLAKFKHPNIVRVFSVFRENNTAYIVMEYEKGRGLHEILKQRKTLPEEELKAILFPILSGLKLVHEAGFIHRDIKPPNIYIREDGSPVLLDFGSARQAMREQTRTLTSMVSPGFAPFEQYSGKSIKQGPWTDIYGLAATMFRAAVGLSPADAMDRSEALLHTEKDSYVSLGEIKPVGYSDSFIKSIDRGLSFKTQERPQSITEWQFELGMDSKTGGATLAEDQIATVVAEPLETEKVVKPSTVDMKTESLQESVPEVKPPSKVRKVLKYGAIAAALLLVLGILSDNKNKKLEAPSVVENQLTIPMETSDTENIVTPTDELEEQTTEDIVNTAAPTDEPEEQTTEDIVNNLLLHAENDIQNLRLTSPVGDNAVEKIEEALKLDPANDKARELYALVADKYVQLTREAIVRTDIESAKNQLGKVQQLNPLHPAIAGLNSDIYHLMASQQHVDTKPVEDKPPVMDEVHKADDLISASDKTLYERLQERLKRNPNDTRAKQALQKIGQQYESRVMDAINNKNYKLAERYLNNLLRVAPDNKKLQETLAAVKRRQQID